MDSAHVFGRTFSTIAQFQDLSLYNVLQLSFV